MKIILNESGFNSKVLLDDGTDITKELRVSNIEVTSNVDNITIAKLTVYPSNVVVEIDDNNIVFVKHSDWDIFKNG